ncbi:MAG: WYL domain-containing protein, partial [Desulfurobacteriaceae bacterium]
RKGKEWKIRKEALDAVNPLNEKEIISFLLFFSFIPKEYRELSFFQPVKKIIERIESSLKLEAGNRDILYESFGYEPLFSRRFIPPREESITKIVDAILKECKVRLLRKDRFKGSNEFREVYPINLFFYEGNFYVGVLKDNGDYRSYLLSTVKIMEVKEDVKLPPFLRKKTKKLRRYRMDFMEKDPFIFGVELNYDSFDLHIENATVFATQFSTEKNSDGTYTVLLVGYNGPRFYRQFLLRDFEKIIPPNGHIIEIAKRNEIKKKFEKEWPHLPPPSYDLEKNKRNFQAFLEAINHYLLQRQEALSPLLKKEKAKWE